MGHLPKFEGKIPLQKKGAHWYPMGMGGASRRPYPWGADGSLFLKRYFPIEFGQVSHGYAQIALISRSEQYLSMYLSDIAGLPVH